MNAEGLENREPARTQAFAALDTTLGHQLSPVATPQHLTLGPKFLLTSMSRYETGGKIFGFNSTEHLCLLFCSFKMKIFQKFRASWNHYITKQGQRPQLQSIPFTLTVLGNVPQQGNSIKGK